LNPALARPDDQALREITVGAADVQEVAVPGHCFQDPAPFGAPAFGPATKPRLPDRIVVHEIRRFKRGDLGEKILLKVCHRL
jgi:hypothetical protein